MTKNSSQANRDYWFDNAKGILILLVFVAHLAELLVGSGNAPVWVSTLYKGIYIFHMPVFIIISGRFAKGRIDRRDWIGVINKIVVPYFVVQTVMMVFYAFTGYGSVSGFSYLSPLFGIWYLITIGVYQLITPYLLKIKGIFWLSLLVAIGIQFGSSVPKGGFMRLFTYYPFFLFGYFTVGGKWEVICKKAWCRALSVLAFAALFAIVYFLPGYFKVGALTLKRVYSAVAAFFPGMTRPEFLAYTVAHYAAGFACFFFLMGISPTGKNLLCRFGRKSNYIYILHLFIIVFLKAADKHVGFTDWLGSDLNAAIYILMALPLSLMLTSGWVKKITAWLVCPEFDLRLLIKQITKE